MKQCQCLCPVFTVRRDRNENLRGTLSLNSAVNIISNTKYGSNKGTKTEFTALLLVSQSAEISNNVKNNQIIPIFLISLQHIQ